jgi:hypothetical protein
MDIYGWLSAGFNIKLHDVTSIRDMAGFINKVYNHIVPYETRRWLYKVRNPAANRRLRTIVNPSAKGDFSLKPFDEHRCIFIHITKTGGTSVAKSLFGYLPYHYTAIEYRVIYGRKHFEQYFKFAFVRNPWDRLYSAYRYLKSGGWDEKDKAWAETNIETYDDFGAFVREWLSKENSRKHLHFQPQHNFICDSKGRLLVDYLAYFETINVDFQNIAKRLHINADLGCHNATPGISYQDVYEEDMKKIVAEVYATDIALFGYDFGGIRQRRQAVA